jgi:A/G-specific adenine glycosylase
MLQQTRMEVVLDYFDRFIRRFPDVASLAAASDDEVMSFWSGLGYYRRARMLRDGARDVCKRFGGSIPRDVESLRQISGIGRYTAGAIASIAFDAPAPIVDGNVRRVIARLFGTNDDPWRHADALVQRAKSPRMLNQGLMELGALICKPSAPICLICPIRPNCRALAEGRINDLPARRAKKPPRSMQIALYLVRDTAGRVLMRRERGPLMNAMFHLPHGDTSLLAGAPLRVRRAALLGSFRHTITTRRIEFRLFEAKLSSIADGDEYSWIDPAEIGRVPHPSYVTKALALGGLRASENVER